MNIKWSIRVHTIPVVRDICICIDVYFVGWLEGVDAYNNILPFPCPRLMV